MLLSSAMVLIGSLRDSTCIFQKSSQLTRQFCAFGKQRVVIGNNTPGIFFMAPASSFDLQIDKLSPDRKISQRLGFMEPFAFVLIGIPHTSQLILLCEMHTKEGFAIGFGAFVNTSNVEMIQ